MAPLFQVRYHLRFTFSPRNAPLREKSELSPNSDLDWHTLSLYPLFQLPGPREQHDREGGNPGEDPRLFLFDFSCLLSSPMHKYKFSILKKKKKKKTFLRDVLIQFILTLALSHNQTVIDKKHLFSGVFRVRALSSRCVSMATTAFQMICRFSHYSALCPGIIGCLFALRRSSHFSLNMLFIKLFEFSDLCFAAMIYWVIYMTAHVPQ